MIGIEIKCFDRLTEFLVKVLLVNNKNDLCRVLQEEIISNHGGFDADNIYFDDPITVENLTRTLNLLECTTIFIKAEIYKEQISLDRDKVLDIDSYDDFLNSNCETLILISDNYYFEVYSKDSTYLNKIAEIANEFGYEVEEKERDNDGRTGMNLW